MYEINCLAILIFRCKQYPDIRCPANARQASVQLAMGKDWAGQVGDHPVQGEPLTAVEGRGVGETKGKLASLDCPAGVLRMEVKADTWKVEGSSSVGDAERRSSTRTI